MEAMVIRLIFILTFFNHAICLTSYQVSTSSSGTFSNPFPSYTCNYNCNPFPCGDTVCFNTCYRTCYYSYDERYQLTAPSGTRVVLVVQASSGDCNDKLEAYEGTGFGTTLLDECCNGYTGLTVTSAGNQMYFRFVNNGDGVATFTVRYFGLESIRCQVGCRTHGPLDFLAAGNHGAGQTIVASQTPTYGPLYPENFPGKYTAEADKYWILKAPMQSHILTGELIFSDFHNCNDRLILRDGRLSTSAVLIQYCTSLTYTPDTSTFTSTQQYIYVEMSLSSGGAYYGFALSYTWIENAAYTEPQLSEGTTTTPLSVTTLESGSPEDTIDPVKPKMGRTDHGVGALLLRERESKLDREYARKA